MEYSISENVFAGNAMNRRLFYQYGVRMIFQNTPNTEAPSGRCV
jgi:alkyl sulfatase BDS1-like metallo-beta-lactamase superfamily hydrolase